MAKRFVPVGKPETFHTSSMKEPDMLELERYVKKLTKQYPQIISWGDIIGSINDQLDLLTIFNSKQDVLVSGDNVKTINGNSILGSGDLLVEPTISGGLNTEFFNGAKQFVAITTSNIAEGVNLYYTDDRARNSVSASTPLAYSSSSGVFTIEQATSSSNGYLSSADWNTFYNKSNIQLIKDSSTYTNFKICCKSITTSSTSHTIDYSEFGFTNLIAPPIITIVRNIANATNACFPILKSYNNSSCVISVAESKTTSVLVLNTSVEGLELVSEIDVQIILIGV